MEHVLSLKGGPDIFCEAISQAIKLEFTPEQCVCDINRSIGTLECRMLVFEKYYMRIKSYAGVTVLLTRDEESSHVDIAVSDAGGGIFNFSYGVKEELVEKIAESVRPYGFEE